MNEKYPDTVDRIISAAIDEFSEKGYYGARVSTIAERAGVSKALLYYHFKNKQDIMNKIEDKLVDVLVNILDNVYSDYEEEGFQLEQHRSAMKTILENKEILRILIDNELRTNEENRPLEDIWSRVNEKRRCEVIAKHGYHIDSDNQNKIKVIDFFFVLIPIIFFGAMGNEWVKYTDGEIEQSLDYFVDTAQHIYDIYYQ